ncbi:unnamed protein product, partial [Owenia fusiformis]
MGQFNSKNNGDADYNVYVKTGDKKGAGTDGNVYISMIDEDEKRSQDVKLDAAWRNDFEAGRTDTFPIKDCPDLKHITEVDIWRDNTFSHDNWYVEKVVIERCKDKDRSVFPIHRWIPANFRIQIQEFDCVLPQHDKHLEQRKKELARKQEKYQLKVQQEGLSAQVLTMPDDESFSNDYKWDIQKTKLQLGFEKLKLLMTGEFKTLDDLKNVYDSKFREPDGLKNWKKDVEFGSQRLTGCNPMSICLCQSIPENFPVTPEMVEPFLEGQTLKDCLDNKKIYIVD